MANPQRRSPSLRSILDNTATFLTASGIDWSGIEIVPLSLPYQPSQISETLPRSKAATSRAAMTTALQQSESNDSSTLTPPHTPTLPPMLTPPDSPLTPPTTPPPATSLCTMPPSTAAAMDRAKFRLRIFVTEVGHEELVQVRMRLRAQEWMLPWVVSIDFERQRKGGTGKSRVGLVKDGEVGD
ncbi:hypothetical protein K440DRAFT_681035 [Wilcoxina mikolae CBS 423.85]|nr:hypothetical protein K440DRAFT_681035 [Wilcoxina mikolae CBS 423.85]